MNMSAKPLAQPAEAAPPSPPGEQSGTAICSTAEEGTAPSAPPPSPAPPAEPPNDSGSATTQAEDPLPPLPAGEDAPARNEKAGNESGEEEEDRPMGLLDHLGELRTRMVRSCIAVGLGFLACWAVVDPLFDILVNPLLAVLPKGSHAIYTTLPEGFFTRVYIAFVAGVFVASPLVFHQIWSFISPGLYEEEKRYVIPIAILSALFFASGGAFCYFIVFPYAFSFFVSFATQEIVAMPKVSDYLGFVLKLVLAFGLIFEMPLFAFFLARMGLVTAAAMRRVRRYAVLAIFIVAAILTPPDVVSQLLMACPMLVLYEVSVWVAAAAGRNPARADAGSTGGAESPENEDRTREEA